MSSKNIKQFAVMQVLPSLLSGGVERGTIEVAKALQKNEINNLVVSSGGPLVSELEKFHIPHIALNVNSKNPLTIIKNSYLLEDIIKEYKVKIVHARSRAPAWSAYLAAKRANAKFITTFHGIYKVNNFLKLHYNKIMTKGEVIIAVSNFVKEHIIKTYNTPESKIKVIHRGVDLDYFSMNNIEHNIRDKFREKYLSPTNTPIILLPARMTEWKGHMVLIEALNKIKHLNFYCLIVGDLSKHPNFVKRVKELIYEYKIQSKVQIFGNENNMLGLYSIADIVLCPSIQPEAFGRVVIEGQAMEKLVIATNIGGVAETIKDKVTGFHIPPNDPEFLAQTIEYALSILGTDEYSRICDNAKKSVIDNFSLNSMLNKILDVYNTLS